MTYSEWLNMMTAEDGEFVKIPRHEQFQMWRKHQEEEKRVYVRRNEMNKRTIRNWLSFLPPWVEGAHVQFVVDPAYDPLWDQPDYIDFLKRKKLSDLVKLLEEKGVEWEMFRLPPSPDSPHPSQPQICYQSERIFILTEREMAKLIQECLSNKHKLSQRFPFRY